MHAAAKLGDPLGQNGGFRQFGLFLQTVGKIGQKPVAPSLAPQRRAMTGWIIRCPCEDRWANGLFRLGAELRH